MSTEDPRPPTLEELIKILRVAKGFTIRKTDFDGQIEVTFTISSKDCDEQGIYIRTFGSLFLAELVEHLGRLHFYESLKAQFSNPDEKGATAADCISFLNNELIHTSPLGLEGTIRRRFFTTIIKKLTELQEWRVFVDRERFENLRKEQQRQKSQYEESLRQQQRTNEEARRYEKEQRQKRRPPPGFEETKRAFEEIFGSSFRDAYNNQTFYRGFGGARQQQQENTFRWSQQQDSASWGNNSNRKTSETRKWWEILGVAANANKATIKSAWRRLAKLYHPDRCNDPNAGKRMAEINAAKDEGLAGAPT